MDAATLLHPRIDTSGKRPVVAGTRLRVSTIARNVEQFGMSVGEMLEAYFSSAINLIHSLSRDRSTRV